jgi:hypothetical protein
VLAVFIAVLLGTTFALSYSLSSQLDRSAEISQRLAQMENRLAQLELSDRELQPQQSSTEPSLPTTVSQSDLPVPSASNVQRFSRGPFGFAQMNQLTDPSVDPEIRLKQARELINSPMPPMQLMAIETLIELQDEQATSAIRDMISAVGDDRRSLFMAERAIDLLADADGLDVDTLLYELVDHESEVITIAAARSLEARTDDNPMKNVIDKLALGLEDADGGVRSRTVQQLGRTRSPAAVDTLSIALNDNNSEVRMRAAQALGNTGADAAIEQLTIALDDPVAEVRSAAARGLDQIRNPQSANNRNYAIGVAPQFLSPTKRR